MEQTRWSTRIYFESEEEKNLMIKMMLHVMIKTGWDRARIFREALMDLNIKFDERGNLK